MRITGLTAEGFQPFTDLRIDFPSQGRKGTDDDSIAEVHLFTGENGTGKTRLLTVLAAALGNREALERRAGDEHRTVSVWLELERGRTVRWPQEASKSAVVREATRMETGCYAYSGHMSLRSHVMTPLAEVKRSDDRSLLDFDRHGDEGKVISQCLYNYAMQAAAESFDDGKRGKSGPSRWRRLLINVQKCIEEITGSNCTLRPQTFPKTTLVLDVFGASLTFDEIPDGLKAVLSWAGDVIVNQELWHVDDPDPLGKPMIILIDEPETHLHPAWQRRVLPALQKLFRNAQIFVVTHSPFIASSLNDGWIHKFTRGADGLVRVTTEEAKKGDTYMDAVEDILGMKSIERFDPESQALLEQFYALLKKVAQGKMPREKLDQLAEQLRDRGGEVASVTESELCQLEAGELVGK